MTDLRVPTTRQPVTITCVDGRAFEGYVFMPSQSSRHQGPMRPDEWTDTVPRFFPFRPHDAVCSTIFSLDAVVAFTVPEAQGPGADDITVDDDLMADVPVARVAVDAGGTSFEGRMTIDMPPDRQRVADWLNASPAFICVRSDGKDHLIHKRHITRIVEMTGIAA